MIRRRRERLIRAYMAAVGGEATAARVADGMGRSVRRTAKDMQRMAAHKRGIHLIRRGS